MGIHAGAATVKISVVVSQKAKQRPTSGSSYITLGHILKAIYILLQTYLLIHVHCCPIYNSQEMKTA